MNKKRITAYIVAVISLSLFMFMFLQKSSALAVKTGKVTVDKLNVRTNAGTQYKVLTEKGQKVRLKKNTTVTILKEKSGWYYVSFTYNKKTLKGYVKKTYVGSIKTTSSATPKTTTTKTGTVNASTLNVRKGAGTSYANVTSDGKKVSLKKNAKVVIYSEKSGWYYVSCTFNKKTVKGYVSKQYVTVDSTSTKPSGSTTTPSSTSLKYKVAAKTREALKVRTAAGTKASQYTYNKVKVTLKKSQTITIRNETVKDSQKWYYVSFTYSGKTCFGWVSGDYTKLTLKSKESATVRPTTAQIYKNTSSKMTVSGTAVKLAKNTSVTISGESYSKGVRYYKISFKYKNKSYNGYIKAYDVNFKTSSSSTTTTPTPTATPKPTSTPKPTVIPMPSVTPIAPAKVLSETEFTKKMTAEGFPADYIKALYPIHKVHPSWSFKAYKTGIKWSTAIANQTNRRGKNTIQSTSYQWISDWVSGSDSTSAYDVVNDKPYVIDGTNWFTASSKAIQYYMDPRNFLNQTNIFMFENLSYDKDNHTRNIVANMALNTPLAGSFTYTDKDGKKITMSYVDAIMDAANYADVSPVHLIARIKQEVLTSSNGKLVFSSSCTGTKKDYEGLYNFFNIGASDSSTSEAINKGLTYAKKGGSNATLNAKMFIPWDNPYKAIMGGAKFLGDSYIEKGQDTLYLQKFNVSSYSTHSHQYMTNIVAPYSEATKSYNGYSNLKMLDSGMVFSIPVYTSMPSTKAISPNSLSDLEKKNFNNYLKDLKIYNGTTTYVSVDKKNFTFRSYMPSYTINKDKVTIAPTVAGKYAKVTSIVAIHATSKKEQKLGASGTIALELGVTNVTITVRADNGKEREYVVKIERKS